MKQQTRKYLTVFLSLAMAVSAVMILRQQMQYRDARQSYEHAAALTRLSPVSPAPADQPGEADPVVEELSKIDLEALRAVNPEVIGWIHIPDTGLSYPVLQGEDNQHYLKYTWDQERNDGGSIFLDCRCSPDLSNTNTLIYGHRMRDDSMFSALKYYEEQEFWQEHPAVYLVTDSGVRVYDIFAAWEPIVNSTVYLTDFPTEEKHRRFLDLSAEKSQLETGIVPEREDRILTLSTCTENNSSAVRWVVQAVERKTEAVRGQK